jgi:hypothetical protein
MKKILFTIIFYIPLLLFGWEQIGPSGIEGRDIKVDEANGTIYVLSYDNMHLYKVDEETNNWEEIILPHPHIQVNAFDVYDDRLYLTKEGFVYISDHIGDTWDLQNLDDGCYDIFILKDHPNILLLQKYSNVWFRSEDFGITWEDLGIINGRAIMYSEEFQLLCLAGYSNVFYKSTDLGASWELINCAFDSEQYGINSGVILNENEYIVTSFHPDSDFYQTVFRTMDGGLNWECINNGSQFGFWGNSIVYYDSDIVITTYLAGYSNDIGLFKLNQTSNLWEEFDIGFEKYLEGTELYSYQNKLYWSTANEGIFKYEVDCESVNLSPENIFRRNIHNINFTSDTSVSVFTSFDCLYIRNDNSGDWERKDSAYFVYSVIQTEQSPAKWLICRKDGLFISNNCDEWFDSMTGIEQNHRICLSKLFKLDDIIICYGRDPVSDDSFIYRSSDFGETWSLVLEGNESIIETSIQLNNVIKVDNIFYGVFLRNGLCRTNDLGLTWESVDDFNYDYYSDGCYNNESFYLLSNNSVLRTVDFVNWSDCTPEIYGAGITKIAFDPNNHNKLFAGVVSLTAEPFPQPHLMISEDSGNTWNEYYIENLDPEVSIRKVYTNSETNKLYVLPIDNSILSCNLDEMNSAEDIVFLSSVSLSNYPNPFNPSTTISFHLNNKPNEQIQIEIYNVRGQKVDQLQITNQVSGVNEIVWNADKFSSGVYFYKLVSNKKTIQNRKMLLLK